jgi:Na+-driven multidrug efflux pump
MRTRGKKGMIESYLIYIILALFALALIMVLIFVLRGTGNSLIDKIKNIFSGVK